jgi:hypothetical protein
VRTVSMRFIYLFFSFSEQMNSLRLISISCFGFGLGIYHYLRKLTFSSFASESSISSRTGSGLY